MSFDTKTAREVAEAEIMFGDSAGHLKAACDEINALRAKLAEAEEAIRRGDHYKDLAGDTAIALVDCIGKLAEAENERDRLDRRLEAHRSVNESAAQWSTGKRMAAEAREAILHESLEFYADPKNYIRDSDFYGNDVSKSYVEIDEGEQARDALEKAKR